MKRFLLALMVLLPAVFSFGQGESFAFVIYAEGFDMSIFRNGELTTYDVIADGVIGMPLLAGDLVQTDADTFVEIQVMPSRTIIKVAENTTFAIEEIGGAGGGVFQMSYGRLRARVERITSADPFEIRGQGAVAGVRGTDFGYDLVVTRESVTSQIETKVYCFEGQVEVRENAPASAPEVAEPSADSSSDDEIATEPAPVVQAPVLISANQMVNVITELPPEIVAEADQLVDEGTQAENASPAPLPKNVSFQTQSIEDEITSFWTEKNFKEAAIDPDEVEQRFPGINEQVRVLSEERQRFDEMQRMRREGLLGNGNSFVASEPQVLVPVEDTRERDPREVQMADADSSDRVRRLITTDSEGTLKDQARIAGNWLTGFGLILGGTGAAVSWFIDDVRSVDDVNAGGPGTALAVSGGMMISTGLISYLISLFTPATPVGGP